MMIASIKNFIINPDPMKYSEFSILVRVAVTEYVLLFWGLHFKTGVTLF